MVRRAVKAIALAAVALLACTPMGSMPTMSPSPMGMNAMQAPPVKGFAEGEEILFLHTEASDPQVAQMLTDMMRSPVLVVPALAEVPASALAVVYVFRNGIRGDGPFGYQPDVFDRPAGRPEYTPLRRVHFVWWADGRQPRVLRSAEEVREAESRGDVGVEASRAVVNMPMLTWPGGHR
jgi:hypothetical protein